MTAAGGPEVLEITERPMPDPAPSEIRVRVEASALNRADISQRLGRYPAPAGSPPDIPGLEYAGTVDAVGSAVTMWKTGDPVMGIVGGGAHAQFLCTHEREAMPIPSGMKAHDAAAIPEVFLTAYDAIFLQLRVRMGESLLIHAVGSGVGTAAIQLALAAGVVTIGTSRSSDKLERAAKLGLHHAVQSLSGDWIQDVRRVTGGSGVDAVLDLVGGGYFAGNLDLLKNRGRMIIVGLTSGAHAELDMRAVMRKRLTIIGTALRARPLEEKIALAREFSDRVIPLFASGLLAPVVDRVESFDRIRSAHALMESNANFGKIVLAWS